MTRTITSAELARTLVWPTWLKYDWLAMDENGEWWAYSGMPVVRSGVFEITQGQGSSIELSLDHCLPTVSDWKNSCISRADVIARDGRNKATEAMQEAARSDKVVWGVPTEITVESCKEGSRPIPTEGETRHAVLMCLMSQRAILIDKLPSEAGSLEHINSINDIDRLVASILGVEIHGGG